MSSFSQWFKEMQQDLSLDLSGRTKKALMGTKHYVFREINIRNYLGKSSAPKLQIGTGTNYLDGWLNTDIEPISKQIAYMDASTRFPFEDNTFESVFSEHNIEHLSFKGGQIMLSEILRVLKPGGRVRIVHPDLARLLELYGAEHSDVQARYMKWMTDRFQPEVGAYDDVHVINHTLRFAGHQFFYDRRLFMQCLEKAGFTEIKDVPPGPDQSEHPDFRGIDSHGKFIEDEEINQYESMAFEAMKAG